MEIGLQSALRLAILLQAFFLLWRLRGGRYGWLLGGVLGVITLIYLQSVLAAEVWPAAGRPDIRSLTYKTLPYLIGPALWLHTLANIDPAFRLQARHGLHLLPYCLALPYSLWGAYQTPYLALEAATRDALGISSWQPFVRMVHLYTYLIGVLVLVFRHGLYGRTARVLLCWVLAMYGLYSLTQGAVSGWLRIGINLGSDLGLLALLYAVTYPQLRWPQSTPPAAEMPKAPPAAADVTPTASFTKYAKSGLRDSDKLYAQIVAYLKENKRYRNPDLGLQAVAEGLGVPANQVSQAVNEHEGSFLQVLNRLRVAEAQQLLRDPTYAHLSVLGIGLEAGFQTKSTYYAAFRRYTGQTPQAYRMCPTATAPG